MVKKEPWSFPGCLFLESRRENLKLNFVLVAVLIRQVLVNTNQQPHFCLVCKHILISCFGLCLLSLVPRPYEPAMGKPADDVLPFNLPSTFPGSYAAPSCGVRRSAAYPSSTSNDVPASANAGKYLLVLFQRSFSTAFLSLTRFWPAQKDCINRVRSLLSMRCMLLGYSFEPRPNSLALGKEGSVVTIGLSINQCSHAEISLTKENNID